MSFPGAFYLFSRGGVCCLAGEPIRNVSTAFFFFHIFLLKSMEPETQPATREKNAGPFPKNALVENAQM